MSVKRNDLIKAARELNYVLGLDPQIKTGKKVTENELSEQILEAAELILPEDDISEETMKVIKLLEGEFVEEEDDEDVDVEETEEQDEEEVENEENVEEEKPVEESKVKTKSTAQSKITRIGAATLVIKRAKNVLTIEDWVKRTDELYVKEGGKPNLKESRYAANVAVKVLEAYGLIEVKGDKVSKLE